MKASKSNTIPMNAGQISPRAKWFECSLLLAFIGLALSGCATPGNFTDYVMRCNAGDAQGRQIAKGVAADIASALGHTETIATDNDVQLYIDISTATSSFNFTAPAFVSVRWVNGNYYLISIEREYNSEDDAEILKMRAIVESAIQKSSCPTYEPSVRYSRPEKLG